jgi:hypothetical protein
MLAGMENSSEVDLEEDLQAMFKAGGSKEMMMGSTIRDLGNTIKEAKNFLKSSGDIDLENDLES